MNAPILVLLQARRPLRLVTAMSLLRTIFPYHLLSTPCSPSARPNGAPSFMAMADGYFGDPAAHQISPRRQSRLATLTTRRRMSALGKSGGRRGGRSSNRVPHVPLGSSSPYIDVPDLSTVWFKTPADNFCFAFETESCSGLQRTEDVCQSTKSLQRCIR